MRGLFMQDPDLAKDLTNRLHQYVHFAQRAVHANVGRVFGLSDDYGPVPLLVLPHFPNDNIVGYLKQNPDKTEKEKVELVNDILRGLTYLHRQGIVHGDVHSGNVFVDDKGFGVLCDAQFDAVMSRDDGSIHSKCEWMPYERLIAEGADDECSLVPPSMAADIYAVALTITQVWTLERPFARLTPPAHAERWQACRC